MVRCVCSGGACAALKQLLTTIVEGERHWSSEAPGCHWSRPCGAATPISASAHMLQVLPSRKLTLPAVAVHRATHLCLSVHARSKHLAALIEEGLSEATAVSLQWFFKGRQRNGLSPSNGFSKETETRRASAGAADAVLYMAALVPYVPPRRAEARAPLAPPSPVRRA